MSSTNTPLRIRLISGAAIFFMVTLALGGGSSRDDQGAYILVPIGSAVLLAMMLFCRWPSFSRSRSKPMLFLASIAALALFQLVPLPPTLWQALPGRDVYDNVAQVAGFGPLWRPISLSPDRTTDFVLALLPLLAAVLILEDGKQYFVRSVIKALLVVATISVALAALQVGDGPSSALRFYSVSNVDAGVGLFANRNHQATLLAMAIPAAGWWVITPQSARIPFYVRATFGLGLVSLFVAGGILTGSRAGLALCAIALIGSAVLVWPWLSRQRVFEGRQFKVLAVAASVAIVAIGMIVVSGHRAFQGAFREDLRATIWPRAWEAFQAFFPTGSGFGTFDRVYTHFESVEELRPEYVNRAHNDLLEIGIEGGLLAYLLLGVFVAWFVVSSVRIWRRHASAPGVLTGRLASMIVFLAIAASATDYPMRTALIGTIFVAACVILHRVSGETASSAAPARSKQR